VYPVKDPSWQVSLTGHVVGNETCNTLRTLKIRLYIPELKMQDAGKYFCKLYTVDNSYLKMLEFNLRVE
ncbi:hypothetical protein BgiMline_036103, partial [Biomphalaria glabrata]